MNRSAALKLLGISPERAKLLRVRDFDFGDLHLVYRALSPLDFLGAGTRTDPFQHPINPYRDAQELLATPKETPVDIVEMTEKLRKMYRCVFLKAILWPRITDQPESTGLCVDDLFVDMDAAHQLYAAILDNSLKKKSPSTSFLARLKNWILSLGGTAKGHVTWPDSRNPTQPTLVTSSTS